MNESEFESELRALRPLPPTAALETAIAEGLKRESAPDLWRSRAIPRTRRGWLGRIAWSLGCASAGAAAAVLAMNMLERGRHQTAPAVTLSAGSKLSAAQPSQGTFVPTESAHELLTAEDGGLLYRDGQAPAEIRRYSSVERHTWANPATGARVEVEMPREDVVLLPVSFQ